MGVRFDGPELKREDETDLISEAVAPGTIQVPPSGKPILLLGDCQTIGGYPKIAHVITVDLAIAAQLRAGDYVRFSRSLLADAHRLLSQRERDLERFRVGLESAKVMKLSVDLNADLGEGSGHDAELVRADQLGEYRDRFSRRRFRHDARRHFCGEEA